MKKILSGLLLSTATLGGVVSIVAQATNTKTDTTPKSNPTVSAGQVNATPFAVDQSPLEIVETSRPVTQRNTLQALLEDAQSIASSVTDSVDEEETVDYEQLQSLRTGINKDELSPEVTLTINKVDELTAQKFQETIKDLKVVAVSEEEETPAEVTLLGEADKTAEEAPVVTDEVGNKVETPVTPSVLTVEGQLNPTQDVAVTPVPATQTLSQVDAEANRVATEQAAVAQQAEAERIAAEQAAVAQQAEAERIAAEQAAVAQQAEAERVAAEQAAAAQQAEAERIAAEQAAAAQQAEANRIAAEQAAAQQAEANRIAAEQAAAQRAEAERIAAEQAAAAQRAEAERIAAEQAAAQRAEAERVAAAQRAKAQATPVTSSANNNTYPIGQCTWGVKELAPWVGNYWGNASNWVNSAQAAGFTVGTNPVPGAIAVWPNDAGSYGHVAVVTSVESATSIQVMEANYAGNQKIGNYRGSFDPTAKMWGGAVYYIYPNA